MRVIPYVGALVSLAAIMGCGAGGSSPLQPSGISRVEIAGAATVFVGHVAELRAIAVRENGTKTDVTSSASWQSSNTAVVRLVSPGHVEVLNSGEVEIRAIFDGHTGTATLRAERPPTITGVITDRLTASSVVGSMVRFEGPVSRTVGAVDGSFSIDLPGGDYRVTVTGAAHVDHVIERLTVSQSADVRLSVLRWGATPLDAAYDETFHRFFHQMSRVTPTAVTAVRKWVVPPRQIYIVTDAVPAEQTALVRLAIDRMNSESMQGLWCGYTGGPLDVVVGPDGPEQEGRITVRPNWASGSTGTLRSGEIRSGTVTVNVFGPSVNRLRTFDELHASLLHEFLHVSFAFHTCGGDLGPNPFGFSPTNCPFPASVMANRGEQIQRLSAQDRLAACLVYSPGTLVGNTFPDNNPSHR